MAQEIRSCRICGNTDLQLILDLGTQYLTGVFPKATESDSVGKGQLELVLCSGSTACGLVQLRHSHPADEMYGENYGYRSGLNPSMVKHLRETVSRLSNHIELNPGDTVIDIGSNDGTTLGFFDRSLNLIGVDPSSKKFASFYREDIKKIPDFFSADLVENFLRGDGAKVVLSIAMMYDLEDPVGFARQVASVLAPDGIWVFEQSYLPTMIDQLAYDTVCHEHIEYYGMKQLDWILREAGLKVVDVQFNSSNGGSIAVTATHSHSQLDVFVDSREIIRLEESKGLGSRLIYDEFAERVAQNKSAIRRDIQKLRDSHVGIAGLGASTKGNVLLQYLELTVEDIPFIGDINPDKHGCVTPGSKIPIVSEVECLSRGPEVLFVLPWHFSDFFENARHLKTHSLYFPLPEPRLVKPR